MNAFDSTGRIQKFDSPEQVADAFFPTRLSLYHDRKSILMSNMEYNAATQKNKARFIQMVADQEIQLVGGKLSKDESVQELKKHGFATAEDLDAIRNNNSVFAKHRSTVEHPEGKSVAKEGEDEEGNSLASSSPSSSYDYLLKMPLSSLTKERIASLTEEASKVEKEFKVVKDTTPEEL
eukprot:CAMPEP_0113507836 /NCGR_PEP_ID=MMETSP0014_2-20120614/36682_1 /TAXON_ID=2857 /ORGANISM="Nitzschia sp." /LENGTH=178 /DNA_ID=CAMNT_0000403481 /DNA_START=174 /DNA_END=708 /DNA_ORIENTATION=- /assembly_acc=CAM_ASM_000159